MELGAFLLAMALSWTATLMAGGAAALFLALLAEQERRPPAVVCGLILSLGAWAAAMLRVAGLSA